MLDAYDTLHGADRQHIELDGAISRTGVRVLTEFCRQYAEQITETDIAELDTDQVHWVLSSVTHGKIAKQLRKLLHGQYGIDTPEIVYIALADIAKRYAHKGDLIVDCNWSLNWSAGDYGDDYSCFFGAYSSHRYALRDKGCFAVRLHSALHGKCGIGRAWCVPLHQLDGTVGANWSTQTHNGASYALFNCYGVKDVTRFAVALAHLLGASDLYPLHSTDFGDIYTNNDTQYLVTDELDHTERLWSFYTEHIAQSVRSAIDHSGMLSWSSYYIGQVANVACEIRTEGNTCCNCNEFVPEDECYYSDNGDCYCESCYCDLFTSCEGCGCECGTDEVYLCTRRTWSSVLHKMVTDENYYCEYCAEQNNFARCDNCGNWCDELADEALKSSSTFLCAECANGYSVCDHCEEIEALDAMHQVQTGDNSTEHWCNWCAKHDADQCAECGAYCANEGTITVHTHDQGTVFWCASCADSLAVCNECNCHTEDIAEYTLDGVYSEVRELCPQCADTLVTDGAHWVLVGAHPLVTLFAGADRMRFAPHIAEDELAPCAPAIVPGAVCVGYTMLVAEHTLAEH